MNIAEKNQGVSSKYWFGTDNLGRDLFSRVWVGARASLIIAIVATAIKLIIGTVYGALMAHFGGWVDEVLMADHRGYQLDSVSASYDSDHDDSWK